MPGKLNGMSMGAKFAITGAAGLLISLGLCGIGSTSNQEFGGSVSAWGLVFFLISTVLLLVAGVSALIGAVAKSTHRSDEPKISTIGPPSDKQGDR